MNPTTQSGMHPDAEVLTAFAEQSATDAEREQILAHIATCGRCREVVFLTQRMVDAEEPSRGASTSVLKEKTTTGWLSGWRWAWVPVAALAGIVGFAVIEHSRHAAAPTTQMAQNAAPTGPALSTAATKAAEAPKVSSQPSRMQPSQQESEQKPAAPMRTDRDAEVDERSRDQKDSAVIEKKKQDSARSNEPLNAIRPGSSSGSSSGLSGGAVHGSFEARAKTLAIGGPMAQNQVQQQNNAQLQQQNNAQLQQQNNAQLQQLNADEARQSDKLSDSANKPAAATTQPVNASQTVMAQAEPAVAPASPAPAAAPVMDAMRAQSESVEVSGRGFAKLKRGSAPLPSKLGVISEVTAGRTVIAIDAAGAVFDSQDGGKHWQAVDVPWSGRAVLVKLRPAATATGGLLKESTPHFELTTDKVETWMSADGKTWTIQRSSPK